MRPIPENSTDLLYTRDFDRDDLHAIGEALGVGDLKVITKTASTPERLLYHACLNGVQTYIKLPHIEESQRAMAIAKITDGIYAAIKDQYIENVDLALPELARKQDETNAFCKHLMQIEDPKKWDMTRYNNCWNPNDYSMRWQKKAIDSYRIMRDRLENGAYQPREGESAGDMMLAWSQLNLRYKHYRNIARVLIEDHIDKNFTPEDRLTMHPADKRFTTMFIGGMGSGKSAMTQHYMEQLPIDTQHDVVLHNADYLKYALYRSAKQEGVLPQEHKYTGAEIQAESSNALYEATRKRAYLARQKFQAPNVILNSIVLGNFEVQEGIAGGGAIVAHHVFMNPEEAVKEAEKRALAGDRSPSASDVQWSTSASAKSLLLLTEPAYQKLDVTVHLYHRTAGKAPVHYGTIDAAHHMLYVHDIKALGDLAQAMSPQESVQNALGDLIEKFNNAGFTLSLSEDVSHASPIATLSPNRKLSIVKSAAFEAIDPCLKVALTGLAYQCQVGSIKLDHPTRGGVLSYGRAS